MRACALAAIDHSECGAYERYYGYRNSHTKWAPDPRMAFLETVWFCGAKVKDVGCNSGRLTMEIARDLTPRFIVGVDINLSIIEAAQRHVDRVSSHRAHVLRTAVMDARNSSAGVFGYGRLPFPQNVWFKTENYAQTADAYVTEDHSYDVICAFSVTKWIHLTAGDAGLVHFFKRVYRELKPGGRFILEPQEWKSYRRAKAKNVQNAQLQHNFATIKLRPTDFARILSSREIGFVCVHCLGSPEDANVPMGFRRPLYCAQKPIALRDNFQ